MPNKSTQPLLIGLKIRAGAKYDRIAGYVNIENKKYLQINIKAIPEEGKANKAIIAFLSSEWQISKSNLEIIRGHTSNFKIIALKNTEHDYLNSILKHYI